MVSPIRAQLIGGSDPLTRGVRAWLEATGRLGLEVVARPSPVGGAEAGSAVEAWIYLAGVRGSEPGVPEHEDAGAVLAAWERSGAPALVVVGSAAVHEPNSHHPGLVAASRRPSLRLGNPIARSWQRLEAAVAELSLRVPGRRVVLLRPAPTPVAGGADFFSRLLSGRLAWTLPGHDPPLQLLAVEDLAAAILEAVAGDASGAIHVAPRQAASLKSALRAAGVRSIPVPRWLQILLRRLAHREVAWLEYIRYSFTISSEATEARSDERRGDDYGQDKAAIDRWGRRGLRFLHDRYWRIETEGLEGVPRKGAAVLVGVHRGFMPFDAIMTLHVVARRLGRHPRYLIHPGLLKLPFFHDFFLRLGGVIACRENADRLLGRGEMVAVLPEGVRGAFALYRDAYRLDAFRRPDHARLALFHGAPIVPYVVVGAAETLPLAGRIQSRWWRRATEWPCLPVPMTLLPVPLPAKWHLRFLPPLEVGPPAPDRARDEATVARLHEEVRHRLLEAMTDLHHRRPAVFWGSLRPP